MKIKRFNNIWTMGLILVGVILIAFYVIKLAFPDFIIGVAETPSIVKFGQYVDTHKWAFHLYNLVIGYLGGYIYCCACCRKYKLNFKDNIILLLANVVLIFVSQFALQYYSIVNYVLFIFVPFLMCVFDRNLNDKTFISTSICFSVDIIAQLLSTAIRNLVIMLTCVNSASMTILLIDTLIWRLLLLCYFNYKNKKEN